VCACHLTFPDPNATAGRHDRAGRTIVNWSPDTRAESPALGSHDCASSSATRAITSLPLPKPLDLVDDVQAIDVHVNNGAEAGSGFPKAEALILSRIHSGLESRCFYGKKPITLDIA